ncbi:hypothetical protein ABZX62_20285 [Streptomyces flavidovirens]
MPVSPAMTEDLASRVRELYEDAEYALLGHLAAHPDLRRKPGREQIGAAR